MATILIVDDNALNRKYLAAVLGGAGHRVIEAANGPEALQLAQRERPDAMVTDIVMPAMDGYELVRRLRALPEIAHTPVIFCSAGYQEAEARTLADACGVRLFIPKPAASAEIIAKVEASLNGCPAAAVPPDDAMDFDKEHLRVISDKLSQKVNELEKVNAELQRLNGELEKRVEERTEELSRKNRLLREELNIARELQFAMLPQRFPTVPRGVTPEQSALHFLSFYRPAGAVSGDFFNVVRLSETRIGLLICDVMGHDVRAALVTAMLRAMSEDFTVAADDPGALLTHINRSLTAIMKKAGTTLFATAFYLIADVAKGELICANAGHPSPLWVHRRDGEVGLLNRGGSGPALGLVADATFPTSRSSIRPGDFVMLFTDGLFEIENPRTSEAFSQQRLLDAARVRSSLPADQLLDGLMEDIRLFADAREFEDDVCVLGMEMNGG